MSTMVRILVPLLVLHAVLCSCSAAAITSGEQGLKMRQAWDVDIIVFYEAPTLEMATLGEHQYYFSNRDHRVSWEEAREFCVRAGLQLANVESAKENLLIFEHIKKLYDRKQWGVWLGATDAAQEGNWVWVATLQTPSFTNFDDDQPGGGVAENCLLMHRSTAHWNDFSCDRPFNFICKSQSPGKLQEVPGNQQAVGTNLELIQLGAHEFYFSNRDNKLGWNAAWKFCSDNGLEFASVESAEENRLVTAHAGKLYERQLWGIWIGATDAGHEGTWQWTSSGQTINYNNFDADQPGGGEKENCLLLHRSDGHWNDFDCNREFVFACKKRNTAAPQANDLELLKIGKHQYYFSNQDNKLSWSAAREFCTSHHLEFARLGGMRENNLVLAHAKKLYERKSWGIWLGASDAGHEGTWTWDSHPEKPMRFANWDSDQPGGGEKENCLLLHRSDGAWNDFDCNREFVFVCKKTAPPPALGTYIDGTATGVNIVRLGERDYYFSPGTMRLNWTMARNTCQQHGLELVNIESAEENRALHAYGKKMHRSYSPWLGGTDEAQEGTWVWDATLQQLQFTNWWHYQPDGKEAENCLYMYADDGKWGDRSCAYTKPFICGRIVED